MSKVLVTGGAGFIGSHTVVELLQAGYEVVVVDNLSNSSAVALDRIAQITGRNPTFEKVDICNRESLWLVFSKHRPHAVIHFAGLKAVGESVEKPLSYYQNNISGTVVLCEVMAEFGVKQLVFSSSATVYGNPSSLPIREDFPLSATNPYGRTKLFIEEMLRDLYASDTTWRIALLRYFNPVGAHPSGLIGEDPQGTPNNLFPFITQVAVGRRKRLTIFGSDYPTPDGTGVRDFIHVVDLVQGHLKALKRIEIDSGFVTCNLGTGKGYSVMEVVRSFEQVSGVTIPCQVAGRRSGDISACYADPSFAEDELGWRASRSLDEMCSDGWRWQRMNPNGYE
ncbi:UDP-glucose/UDP-N-acetylglucosamine 4-epimerase [Syntrophotalea carbinolica DSM 2380]|uniref:UDP-glucose 4-epimerase n=1 Tax=Syntrophotalea carbinolica (strain DSM 2380 / NBRC 103641 / GraBd1) TaxID=338963 RepID=Q3A3L2_SYNC1|nr:UDP-glucose 4-epimerase GalE [Syntrophotalea carbinolica]ABA89045.1 UDP-glucose/UDP-N-acetylglucosamine 4-epimerase [Syntrophotalea carbinolica DSM 2380]